MKRRMEEFSLRKRQEKILMFPKQIFLKQKR